MIKSMTVKIDNAEVTEVFYEKAKPLIYSMIMVICREIFRKIFQVMACLITC